MPEKHLINFVDHFGPSKHAVHGQYAWEKFYLTEAIKDFEWVLWKTDEKGVLRPMTPKLRTKVIREIVPPGERPMWRPEDFEVFIERCKDEELVELATLVAALEGL